MATVTRPAQRRAPKTGRASSSVFKKSVMAVSGIILVLYLIAHMIGNLKAFAGAESFNEYSGWIRSIGEPAVPTQTVLWVIRLVLLAAVVAHMWAAFSLWKQARAARPVRYVTKKPVQQSYASRTLRWGGVIIALFIVWHILDLTLGTVNSAGADSTPYERLVASFSNPFVTAFYVVALVLLGFHLRHGIWSAAQTLGQSNKRRERLLNVSATVFAFVLIGGFLLAPAGVLLGIVD
ncbi:succinate dehydrogenase cytochrome b subunit [Geodermatophilus sp. YIM 151500]|uniref:succinate dehydrogenase cytochrome b subunit n=1 Tax=Geodermatophilus sp. YIM 151500 TaxID=2984531 RepID=UPI0021E4B2B9|nr:succinate dehydrogenase cytochrome b subunit [Geodermatophilus sp. YIM 151500]MCV2489412.1 succinate dehydrogenase cytochrome b subunit [Geodermatophilus sp. YIM 151500]